MARYPSKNPFAPAAIILATAAALTGLSGCYERVVGAKGFGADQYNVAEPYQESGTVDEWIFGTPNPAKRKTNHTLLPGG